MAQAILMTGQKRRRRFSPDDRLDILEAAFAPGTNVSQASRRLDISTGLLYTWRRQRPMDAFQTFHRPSTPHVSACRPWPHQDRTCVRRARPERPAR